MKKSLLTLLFALMIWSVAPAQVIPAPDKYNSFLEQLSKLPLDNAKLIANATMEALKDNPKAYRQMLELAENRFGEPTDSIHNEELYIAFMQHANDNFVLSTSEKERHRLRLMGALRNRIGEQAADFDYITPNDETVHYLRQLKSPYILLFFNNPDCESCTKVKERLATSEIVNKMVDDGTLTVLAVYPYDYKSLWLRTEYPDMMINGFNQSRRIEYDELYDLPTLPVFYLLDGEQKVVLKNEASLKKVEAYLSSIIK